MSYRISGNVSARMSLVACVLLPASLRLPLCLSERLFLSCSRAGLSTEQPVPVRVFL